MYGWPVHGWLRIVLASWGWACLILLAGCEYPPADPAVAGETGLVPVSLSGLSGSVSIEGSSTVEPISIRARERFGALHPRVNVMVSGQGTSNGYAALGRQECDICDASRPAKSGEMEKFAEAGVGFFELPVAFDGLTIVVNRNNSFIESLTLDQLKTIFREDRAAKTWKEVDPSWPDHPIAVFAPGIKSGTHDYFVEIIGRKDNKKLRDDQQMTTSENDKQLVLGVRDDPYAIGFFGFAYYEASRNDLRAIPVVHPATGEAIMPTAESIESGLYFPFSRPLLIVVNADSYRREEVREFVDFYLAEGAGLARDAGYIPLPPEMYERARQVLRQGQTGTHFLDGKGEHRQGPLAELYIAENLRQ